MSNQRYDFTTPVGRLVGGSIYKVKDKDHLGQPRVVKNGPNAGQPLLTYDFAVAIPKIPGQHWATYPRQRADQPSWGEAIYAAGSTAFPQAVQRPDFAWKVIDGDSTIPNKNNKRPCDIEGYAGHWVVWFSSSTPPQCWNNNGTQRLVEENAIKPGYYVQVMGNATSNKSQQSPGVFVNHSMVALSGFGPEISMGLDVSAAGFGQGVQLPAGASATPVGGFNPPAAAGAPVPPAAASAPVPATPAPGFVAAAGAQMPPMPPTPPAAPAGPQMTPKANGASYQSFIDQGWTDALLREHGYLV